MTNTTLCYIERNGSWLMMLRNKKKNDENEGKWIGVGGHFEEGESPQDCCRREIREETGLEVTSLRYRGLVTFVSDAWGTEYMHLFTAVSPAGEVKECDEGELRWIPREEVPGLNLWEGDRAFLRLLTQDRPFFSMKLTYHGDELAETLIYDE